MTWNRSEAIIYLEDNFAWKYLVILWENKYFGKKSILADQ